MTIESSQPAIEISTLQAEFLGALHTLGGSAGNGKLQQLLDWDDACYESIKAELMLQGQIQAGRGRGGSITLTESQGAAIASPPASQTATPIEPQPTGRQNLSAFIWSVADLLRGDYKQSDYGKIILPFTVLRRLDCVLAPTKAAVLEEKALRESQGLAPEPFLLRNQGKTFAIPRPSISSSCWATRTILVRISALIFEALRRQYGIFLTALSFTCKSIASRKQACCTW
nr:type I restriction-modification system subunit M N-terminal domain-containing protein [Synechococcus elongatus]